MKKYGISLLMVCITTSCLAEVRRKSLIDIMDDARKQVETVTCKIRDVITPQRKKEETTLVQAQALLARIQKSFTTLRTIVIDALEQNSFNAKLLESTLKGLEVDQVALSLLEKLDIPSRDSLKESSDQIVFTFQALLEETGVLDLWVQGYDAYSRDLEDNFKNLPNAFVQKPDFKKLYEELGIPTAQGKKASFSTIQDAYKNRFDELKKQHGKDFDDRLFRPYLRVLQYVFRTFYSKAQYDLFLAGKDVYTTKSKVLEKHKGSIQKLFGQDLPALRLITGTLQAEIC